MNSIIPGDIDSRRAYYDALEICNLAADKDAFLIANHVKLALERLLVVLG